MIIRETILRAILHAHPGLGGKFEVSCFDDRFIVTLGDRTCSCRQWDITGIPCKHAVAALHFIKEEPTDYVHECFSVEKYLKAYAYGLELINGEKMWPKGVGYPVEPPLIRAMPGRPKKKRRRDADERDPNNSTRLKRIVIRMICQKCFQLGHNIRSCKNEPVEKAQTQQRLRGRPRKHPLTATERPTTTRKRRTTKAAPVSTLNASTAPTSTSTASAAPSSTLHLTTHAPTSTKTIMKERSQALRGLSRFVTEGTGNIYVNMSTRSARANFIPPRPNTRSQISQGNASGAGSSTTTSNPTQESHAA